MLFDTRPNGIWEGFPAAFLCHTYLVRGGWLTGTGSSTNIRGFAPQIFVSHGSWEPLNFTGVFTSQTKAINKVNLQYPQRGWEKKSTLEVKIK